MPWSKTYYGLHGPWQVVEVFVGFVGGSDYDLRIERQQTKVDLMPDGERGSFILSREACSDYSHRSCGRGGLWEPQGDTPIAYQPAWDDWLPAEEVRGILDTRRP